MKSLNGSSRSNSRRTRLEVRFAVSLGAFTSRMRFGSALNLNVHCHMFFLDGVCLADGAPPPVFRQASAPDPNDLQALVEQIAARVGQLLERHGLIERENANACAAT